MAQWGLGSNLISDENMVRIGNRPARLQRSLPPGPKCRKSLENVSRGLQPRDPKKSPESLGGSPKTLSRHFPETLRRLPLRLFGGFLGSRGLHFRDFFGISGPNGLRGLCKGRAGSQGEKAILGILGPCRYNSQSCVARPKPCEDQFSVQVGATPGICGKPHKSENSLRC